MPFFGCIKQRKNVCLSIDDWFTGLELDLFVGFLTKRLFLVALLWIDCIHLNY